MNPTALRLDNVQKSYGATRALDGLTLSIPKGAIAGLVGPNGAGKTTAFSVVGGAVQPDSGSVDILGQGPFDARLHAGRVSLLPQDAELNPHTNIDDLLTYFGELQGLSRAAARTEASRVLDRVMLSDRKRSKVKELSHGMRRRVAIAQALLGRPELILLDEPTSGLDPALVAEVKEILKACRGTSTLIVSSHVLADLEAVCDHVIFMKAGRCTKEGDLAEVTGQKQRVRVKLQKPIALDRLREVLSDVEFQAEGNDIVFQAPPGLELPALNAKVLPALLAINAEILEVERGESLEAAYMADVART